MSNRITTIKQIVAYAAPDNPWLKVYFDKVRFPDGTIGHYNRVVESEGKPGIAILPLLHNSIGLVIQHRYPINREVWEIPRGFAATGIPLEDAQRELQEETHIYLSQNRFESLGSVYPNSGMLASEVFLFLAVCTEAPTAYSTSTAESLRFEWFPVPQVLDDIASGSITDVFTICAITRADLRGLLPKSKKP